MFLSKSGMLEHAYQDEQHSRGFVTCAHDGGLYIQCSDTSRFVNPSAFTHGPRERMIVRMARVVCRVGRKRV